MNQAFGKGLSKRGQNQASRKGLSKKGHNRLLRKTECPARMAVDLSAMVLSLTMLDSGKSNADDAD